MEQLLAGLIGAVVGGTLSILGSVVVMRAERRYRAVARVLLHLVPEALRRLRAFKEGADLSAEDRLGLQETTEEVVVALSLGGRRERCKAGELLATLPDFNPRVTEDTSLHDLSTIIAEEVAPGMKIDRAIRVIKSIRTDRIKALAGRRSCRRLRRTAVQDQDRGGGGPAERALASG